MLTTMILATVPTLTSTDENCISAAAPEIDAMMKYTVAGPLIINPTVIRKSGQDWWILEKCRLGFRQDWA